ncbi:MAG: YafY family transcriptional regulator [Hamadaea sp.]|nr:YafY family transcriptional regulator [Hamadaea sp.]
MLDTSARLLRLLATLPIRPEWTGPELAERLGVTVRTVRRDIVRLRELGYPVVATPGVAGGYRMAAGSALPPLLFDDDEAVAVILSLRTAAGTTGAGFAESSARALAKIERILPARLRRRASALRSATVAVSGPPTVRAEQLTVLAEACAALATMTFGYRDRTGAASARTVDPLRLVHAGRRWYLVARDHDRDGWRTFRVDRIEEPRATGATFVPRDPPDAAAFVAESLTSAPYRYRARIQVRAPAHAVADRVSPTSGIVETVDRDTCLLSTGADSLTAIAMHVAALGHPFAVLEPPELVEEVGRLADRLRSAYADSASAR